MAIADKAPNAFRTIGELSVELGVAQHILRYWESKFPQLRPLQRAGNRRYYRPADVDLARRINRLLNLEGYTVRGAQQLLQTKGSDERPGAVQQQEAPLAERQPNESQPAERVLSAPDLTQLIELRDRLRAALDA
jgi:DNA-binding transcriptional MerR regulator